MENDTIKVYYSISIDKGFISFNSSNLNLYLSIDINGKLLCKLENPINKSNDFRFKQVDFIIYEYEF